MPNSAPLVERFDNILMSAEALVPVTVERAVEIAEAVVGLGQDASVDVVDAAVADVMGLEVTDPIVGDLGWSVSTPLEEAWADARARAAVATLAAQLKLDLNPTLAATLKTALSTRTMRPSVLLMAEILL